MRRRAVMSRMGASGVLLLALALLAGCSGDPRESVLPRILTEKVPEAKAVGSESCTDCHEAEPNFYKQSYHRDAFFGGTASGGCESCHGKGSVHSEYFYNNDDYEDDPHDLVGIEDLGAMSAVREVGALPAVPPAGLPALADVRPRPQPGRLLGLPSRRPALRSRGTPSTLRPVVNGQSDDAFCTQCHESVSAEFKLQYHHRVPEGQMKCADCHPIHGEPQKNMVVAGRNETCQGCHPEIQGPWVYEHLGMEEGCDVCHTPARLGEQQAAHHQRQQPLPPVPLPGSVELLRTAAPLELPRPGRALLRLPLPGARIQHEPFLEPEALLMTNRTRRRAGRIWIATLAVVCIGGMAGPVVAKEKAEAKPQPEGGAQLRDARLAREPRRHRQVRRPERQQGQVPRGLQQAERARRRARLAAGVEGRQLLPPAGARRVRREAGLRHRRVRRSQHLRPRARFRGLDRVLQQPHGRPEPDGLPGHERRPPLLRQRYPVDGLAHRGRHRRRRRERRRRGRRCATCTSTSTIATWTATRPS